VGEALPAESSTTHSVRGALLEFFIKFIIEFSAILSVNIN
jgi:hypothetical protein